MKQQFNHDKETKLNTVVVVQRHILQEQLDKLQSLVINKIETPLSEKCISTFLLQRAERDKRILDEFEMAILAFMDSDGKISSVVRLQDLMYLMTRISKVDQRALCLYILNDRLDDNCRKSFVELGGYRLLKRWIRVAEEEDCVDELTLIVTICKQLPFNAGIVKETEIGKSIKKLLKFQSDSDGVDTLKATVKSLMEQWTEEMKALHDKSVKPEASTEKTTPTILSDEAVDLLELVNERLFTQRKQNPQQSQQPAVVAKEAPSSVISQNPGNEQSGSLSLKDPLEIDVDSEMTPGSARSPEGSTPTGGATLRASLTGPTPALNTLREKIKQEKEGKQRAGTDILALLQNKKKAPAADPDAMDIPSISSMSSTTTDSTDLSESELSRRALDTSRGMELMADRAMKLLAARELAEKMRTVEDKMQTDDMDADVDYAQIAKPKANIVLKSCLKKKNPTEPATTKADSGAATGVATATSAPKEKRSLKWADDSGGELREVRTFEVKNLKKSTASYKSHRDLVKKERMLEKSSNISKIVEAMQPTTKWATPKPRVLSFEMQENACGPVESPDSEIQASRIAHILEARYMDDSSIPAEPDEAASARELFTDSAPPKEVSWFISDSVQDQDDTDRIIHGYQVLQYNPSFDATQHTAQQDGAWGLPPVLQGLEREMLDVLMQDEAKLVSILNDDRTINEWKLDQLRIELNLPPRGGFGFPVGDGFRGGFLPNPGQFHDGRFGYGGEDPYAGQFSMDSEPPSFHHMHRNETMPRPRNSRWSAPVDPLMRGPIGPDGDMYHLPQSHGGPAWQQEGGRRQFGNQPVHSNDKYGPSGFGGGGSGGGNGGFMGDERDRFGPGSGDDRKRVRPQKTSTPCKFFNTPKGCQFGSKCAFGHYSESNTVDRAPTIGGLGGVPKRSRFSPPATMTDSFGR